MSINKCVYSNNALKRENEVDGCHSSTYHITEVQAFLEDVISLFLCQLIPCNYVSDKGLQLTK